MKMVTEQAESARSKRQYVADKRAIRLVQHHAVEAVCDGGGSHMTKWRATDDDPCFNLVQPNGTPVVLKSGWYVLTLDLTADVDGVLAPKLYPDYGSGYSEKTALSLQSLLIAGGVRGVVRFISNVRGLRFDPLDAVGEFALGRVRLRRVSRLGAILRMLTTITLRDGRPLHVLGEAWRHLQHDRPALRGLGEWAYQRSGTAPAVDLVGYADWVERYDSPSRSELKRMARNTRAWPHKPLISVVMPTYNTSREWLEQCIDSVRRQVYPNWELCIADDASSAPHMRRVLQRYARRDARIKVVFRETNGHISAASNSALQLASGQWLALLDHDDELPPDALYQVARAINAHPDAKLFYSDEDKVDERGKRFDPYLKPDWNPLLFCGHNLFSHLGVYDRELVREVDGFRVGWEGSQDYDLAFRCLERVRREQVIHIPRVLYHWRAISGSTALGPDEKSYAHVAANKAITAHFERVGVAARVSPILNRTGNWRVRFDLPPAQPHVSIIVPTRNGGAVLQRCLQSIQKLTRYEKRDVLVVDNRSDQEETLRFLDELRKGDGYKVCVFDEPFNFSRINNFAVRKTSGDVLVFLNDDTEVIAAEWLEELVSLAMQPDTGAVGAMLYYPNDSIQHAGIVLGLGKDRIAGHAYHGLLRGHPGDKCRAQLVQEVSAVTAACMAVRRDRFDAVHGFDESLAVAFNDVDLCLRLQDMGWRNVWTPNAQLYHYESKTRGSDLAHARRAEYLRECDTMRARWGTRLLNDPYYHPSLSLNRGDFATYVEPRTNGLSR